MGYPMGGEAMGYPISMVVMMGYPMGDRGKLGGRTGPRLDRPCSGSSEGGRGGGEEGSKRKGVNGVGGAEVERGDERERS